MMKEGKDDQKIMGPLFPRLHINDVEKGGPRAAPRNKMALYEQLSHPTPKCGTGQALLLPLPPKNCSALNPLLSSSQGGQNESNAFPSFYVSPPTPAQSNDKLHPLSYDVLFMKTPDNLEQKTMETETYPSVIEYLDLSWATESGSLQPPDDCMVPAFAHSKITQSSSKYPQSIDKENKTKPSPSQPGCSTAILGNNMPKTATNNFSSSMQRNSRDKQLKRTNTTDLTSRQHGRNPGEENPDESLSNKEMQKLASKSSTKEHASEILKPASASMNQGHQNSPVEGGGVETNDSQLHQEYKARPPKSTVGSNDVSVDLEKANVPRGDKASCLRASLLNDHRSCNNTENGRICSDRKAQCSSQVQSMNRHDDSSETSMADSTSRLEITPGDVVGAIGHKNFWKARRALVKQRRLFEMQVFELHRLVKVQRSIAGSPNLLLEDPYLSEPSLNVTRKKLRSEPVLKSPPQIKARYDAKKPKQGPESAQGTSAPSDNLTKQCATQSSSYGPYSGNQPPPPVAPTGNKTLPPWYFHQPPGNQMFLPVMSPTEGLVYKPISGAFPPTAGFAPLVYGGWGPMTVPYSFGGGYLNPAFGFPGIAPVGPMYPKFMNTANSASPLQNKRSWVEAQHISNLKSYQQR